MVTVVIAKSDYPNGRFGFIGELDIVMENTAQRVERMFTVERTGGLLGDQTVSSQRNCYATVLRKMKVRILMMDLSVLVKQISFGIP